MWNDISEPRERKRAIFLYLYIILFSVPVIVVNRVIFVCV